MSDGLSSPFRDLRSALGLNSTVDEEPNRFRNSPVRIDRGRWRRTGIPEVVHAELKSPESVATGLRDLVEIHGRALASRVRLDEVDAIRAELGTDVRLEVLSVARCVVASRDGASKPESGGVIGVLSAGTSDVPVAAEAAIMAREMGCSVIEAWDVGVAGLHRLVEPIERLAAERADAIVVAAGMDGALPSVVAGLVDVPVIGLPTSVGYGHGGAGVAALGTMLQSCAPGLVVVNIDNGIGAGATAALIANRAAAGRRSHAEP
jgi:NCAIR mutase (PurE)-related protein